MTNIHEDIYAGSKSLSVDIDPDRNTASVRFGTRHPRWVYPKMPGDTTSVFRKADTLLAATAMRIGRSILLQFDTANTHLKQWVLAHEADLGFDAVEPRDNSAYRITVQKRYRGTYG